MLTAYKSIPVYLVVSLTIFSYGMDTTAFLFDAIKRGATNEVREIINTGIDVNIKNSKGCTALYAAVESWHEFQKFPIAKLLLDAGADVNGRSIYDNFWNTTTTALHRAVCYRDNGTVGLLIGAGADLYAKGNYNRWYNSTIPLATFLSRPNKDPFIEQMLCEAYIKTALLHGNLAPEKEFRDVINQTKIKLDYNKLLGEPLFLLTQHKTVDLEALILSNKGILNQQDNLFGATLLMYAATLGHYDIVQLLFQYEADPLIKTKQNKNVFDFILHILNNKELTLEKRDCYEKIMQRCLNEICDHYILPTQLACLKATNKNNAIPRGVILAHLVAPMIGSSAATFKPREKPIEEIKTLSTPTHTPSHQPSASHSPAPLPQASPSDSPARKWEEILTFNGKKSLTIATIGALAVAYALYWYSDSKEPVKPVDVDDQLIPNATNAKNETRILATI